MHEQPLKQNAGPQQIARARRFRKEMPLAEQKVWQALRGRRFKGLKFRRQFPIENYTVDFVCLEAALVIELDGESHDRTAQADAQRTAVIEANGFRVIRFPNEAVMFQFDGVLRDIFDA